MPATTGSLRAHENPHLLPPSSPHPFFSCPLYLPSFPISSARRVAIAHLSPGCSVAAESATTRQVALHAPRTRYGDNGDRWHNRGSQGQRGRGGGALGTAGALPDGCLATPAGGDAFSTSRRGCLCRGDQPATGWRLHKYKRRLLPLRIPRPVSPNKRASDHSRLRRIQCLPRSLLFSPSAVDQGQPLPLSASYSALRWRSLVTPTGVMASRSWSCC